MPNSHWLQAEGPFQLAAFLNKLHAKRPTEGFRGLRRGKAELSLGLWREVVPTTSRLRARSLYPPQSVIGLDGGLSPFVEMKSNASAAPPPSAIPFVFDNLEVDVHRLVVQRCNCPE